MQACNKWAKCQLNEKKKISEALIIYIYEFIYVPVVCVVNFGSHEKREEHRICFKTGYRGDYMDVGRRT